MIQKSDALKSTWTRIESLLDQTLDGNDADAALVDPAMFGAFVHAEVFDQGNEQEGE
jgi:hypothetical protein